MTTLKYLHVSNLPISPLKDERNVATLEWTLKSIKDIELNGKYFAVIVYKCNIFQALLKPFYRYFVLKCSYLCEKYSLSKKIAEITFTLNAWLMMKYYSENSRWNLTIDLCKPPWCKDDTHVNIFMVEKRIRQIETNCDEDMVLLYDKTLSDIRSLNKVW